MIFNAILRANKLKKFHRSFSKHSPPKILILNKRTVFLVLKDLKERSHQRIVAECHQARLKLKKLNDNQDFKNQSIKMMNKKSIKIAKKRYK